MFDFNKIKLRATKLIGEYIQKSKKSIITKDECKKAIILIRLLTIKNIEITNILVNNISIANRKLNKSNQEHNTDIVITTSINDVVKNLKAERIVYGSKLKMFLSKWKELGATTKDLMNICNINKSYIEANNIHMDNDEKDLFNLLFIYYFDYKDTGEVIEMSENAPLTILAREYMLLVLLRNNDNEAIIGQVLKNSLGDLELYTKITLDGKEYLISGDGLEIIPLD